jgi:hypothetical protein
MIPTRNLRIRNLHPTHLFNCPYSGCSRSFRNISGQTQHIHAIHECPPQANLGPDSSGGSSRSPSADGDPDPNNNQYPDIRLPHTPSTLARTNPALSPAQSAGEVFSPDPSQYSPLGSQFNHDEMDIDAPLFTPSTSAPTNPIASAPQSPLGSPFHSEPDMDFPDTQIPSPNPLRFDISSRPASPQLDGLGSSPHPPRAHAVERDHGQDHRDTGPTNKTFHTHIDGTVTSI